MSLQRPRAARERGFSLIEVMVGIVIALISILVIYQVFSVAEGIKRNVTGAGDAQQNGLLSAFTMMLQFSDAGANLAVAGDQLDSCQYVGDIAATLRPIPVLITDSGSDTTSDTFVVNYGASQRVVTPVAFQTVPPTFSSNADYVVQSPLGFQLNDVVVLISSTGGGAGTGKCTASLVNAVPSVPDADGYVTLKHSAPDDVSVYNASSMLLNLGPSPRRISFDVDANGTLRSRELFHIDADNATQPFSALNTPVPVSNNIVLMKVQYGIGDPVTGYLQKWVKATNDGVEDWSANAVLTTKDYIDLSRIKAVRIALIVRSESYDKCAYADVCPGATTNTFTYSLFSQCDGVPCPDPLNGSLDPTPGKGNFRYRVYETVVPLRNAVWNMHKKA